MNAPSPPPDQPEAGAPHDPSGLPAALRWLATGNIAVLGAQAVALSVYLWPQWRHNPDLAHGLFMPLIFVWLLWESRRHGPFLHPRAGALPLAATALFAAVALAALVAAGFFAVSLGWSHNLVSFMVTAAFTAALLTGWAALSQEPLAFWPLNWIAFSAIVLWLLAAPLPPGTYTTLTLKLQGWVTGHVLTALQVLGVAARQRGNMIELAGTTVGVEEACSGIRSLVSCVFVGFFFSALWVRRPWARALLLLLAGSLAIAMNFVRSLTLTLLANAGVDITGFWHEATGFAVLGVTAAVLAILAFLLTPRRREMEPVASEPGTPPSSPRALYASQIILGALLVFASGVAAFFISHTRPKPPDDRPPPDLAAVLPAAAAGWNVKTAGDLYRFADTLQTSHLVQRTYFKGGADNPVQITVFLAYWPAGQTTVSNVAVHTPDACWPGVGWQAVPSAAASFTPVVGGQALAAAEYRLFVSGNFPQHVWFWHLYDGAPITQRDPRSPRELLSIAWRYGFRKDGDQLFVRVSSNRPWNTIAGEPLVDQIFTHLHAFGL